MKDKFLTYLVCPECKEPLELEDIQKKEEGEIMEGKLSCLRCGHSFPITRGIPRILPKSEYTLSEKTKRNFAFSWRKFANIYKDPRDFLDWIYPKKEIFFKDKVVLDAGCGTGKHALFSSQFGAQEVIAFDISNALELAFPLACLKKNVHLVQADIYHLPFKDDFDYIYSIGVLQHLPDPEKGFKILTQLLKKGGWSSIWVYGHEGTGLVRKIIDPIRRNVFSRLPLWLVLFLSFFLTSIIFFLAKGVYQPLSKFKFTEKILEFLPMSSYLVYMSQFEFFYIFNSIFDQLIAPITQYFRRQEIEDWFQKAGLEQVIITNRNEMSWRASGQKPG